MLMGMVKAVSGGGGNLTAERIDCTTNDVTRTINDLTVGKEYLVVVIDPMGSVSSVTLSLQSVSGATYEIVDAIANRKNVGYSYYALTGVIKIVPSQTSVSLTFDRGDTNPLYVISCD